MASLRLTFAMFWNKLEPDPTVQLIHPTLKQEDLSQTQYPGSVADCDFEKESWFRLPIIQLKHEPIV